MKTLAGPWLADTMDGQRKYVDGNECAHILSSKRYVAKIYPIDDKYKEEDDLKKLSGVLSTGEARI